MAAPTDLQSAESYFGGGSAPPPTVAAPNAATPSPDDLQSAESYFSTGGLAGMKPQQGPAQDTLWSSLQSAGARILSKTGFGVQNAWGADPYDFAEQRQALVKAGMLDAYNTGHQTFVKSATESLLRNAIVIANLPSQAMRGVGAAFAGVAAGSEAVGQEIEGKNPNAVQSALAYPFKAAHELTEDPTYLFGLGVDAEGETARATGGVLAAREADNLASATKGRALGTLGEGEAGYYDAAPPTPENVQARSDSASEAGIAPPQPVPPPDIHVLARRIDPDTFEQFDALAAERDQHRETVAALGAEREASPEAVAARGQIDTILGKVNGVTDRLTKAASDRLADAQARLDDVLNRDTPEMTTARNALMDADFKMRDLAPDVSDAYHRAADMAPQLAEAHDLGEAQLPGEQATKPIEESAAEPLEGVPQRAAPAAVQASGEAAGFAPGENVLGEQKIGGSTEDSGAADKVGQSQEGVEPTTAQGAVKTGQARYGDLKAVEGTGELQTRSLSENTEAKAIEDGLTQNFGDLPEYRTLSMKDQAAQVSKLMDADYESAKAIAMGERQPPKGVLPESVYVGVEKRALAEGDVETLQKLATRSKLTTSATTMGQRIRTLGERDQASPVAHIQEVQAAREADLASRTDVQAAKRDTVAAIKKEVRAAASKKDAWESFIQSIKC